MNAEGGIVFLSAWRLEYSKRYSTLVEKRPSRRMGGLGGVWWYKSRVREFVVVLSMGEKEEVEVELKQDERGLQMDSRQTKSWAW